jgi:hypothetical protein
MDPVAPQQGEVQAAPYAPRPHSLQGRTLGLIWNGKAHGDDALKRAGELMQKAIPGLRVNFYSGALPCPAPLLNKAKKEIDIAIGCTAD